MIDTEIIMETSYPNLEKIKRGKVRDIYRIPNRNELLIVATDRISAFDVIMPNGIPNKGESLNSLSVYWFEKTRKTFPNHYIESVDNRMMHVTEAERIDVEWVIRGNIYGSAWRAYENGARRISGVNLPNGLRKAEELPEPILTPTTKEEMGHDSEISKQEAIYRNLVKQDEWKELEEAAFKLFNFYKQHAKQRGIIISDSKLEFGRTKDGLIQIDEPPTHDSARFWAEKFYRIGIQQEGHALDKEFLRQYLLSIGFKGEGKPPALPAIVVEEISKRCFGAYQVLSGKSNIDLFNLKSIEQVIYQFFN